MTNKEEFYTAEELAEKLKVNIMTIYRHITKYHTLQAYKIGKEYRIEKKEFDRFLKECLKKSK